MFVPKITAFIGLCIKLSSAICHGYMEIGAVPKYVYSGVVETCTQKCLLLGFNFQFCGCGPAVQNSCVFNFLSLKYFFYPSIIEYGTCLYSSVLLVL